MPLSRIQVCVVIGIMPATFGCKRAANGSQIKAVGDDVAGSNTADVTPWSQTYSATGCRLHPANSFLVSPAPVGKAQAAALLNYATDGFQAINLFVRNQSVAPQDKIVLPPGSPSDADLQTSVDNMTAAIRAQTPVPSVDSQSNIQPLYVYRSYHTSSIPSKGQLIDVGGFTSTTLNSEYGSGGKFFGANSSDALLAFEKQGIHQMAVTIELPPGTHAFPMNSLPVAHPEECEILLSSNATLVAVSDETVKDIDFGGPILKLHIQNWRLQDDGVGGSLSLSDQTPHAVVRQGSDPVFDLKNKNRFADGAFFVSPK